MEAYYTFEKIYMFRLQTKSFPELYGDFFKVVNKNCDYSKEIFNINFTTVEKEKNSIVE